MSGPQTPLPARPLSPAGEVELGRLLAGLDHLDRLLRLPAAPIQGEGVPFGRYRLRSRVGAGRYGVVFAADDPAVGRPVAVKVPQPAILADPALRALFVREARAAGRLDHPGVVPVYEAGEDGGLAYLVSALVAGPTLAAWLGEHPGPLAPPAPPPCSCPGWPRPWPTPTIEASCTATSSRATCSWPRPARRRRPCPGWGFRG